MHEWAFHKYVHVTVYLYICMNVISICGVGGLRNVIGMTESDCVSQLLEMALKVTVTAGRFFARAFLAVWRSEAFGLVLVVGLSRVGPVLFITQRVQKLSVLLGVLGANRVRFLR